MEITNVFKSFNKRNVSKNIRYNWITINYKRIIALKCSNFDVKSYKEKFKFVMNCFKNKILTVIKFCNSIIFLSSLQNSKFFWSWVLACKINLASKLDGKQKNSCVIWKKFNNKSLFSFGVCSIDNFWSPKVFLYLYSLEHVALRVSEASSE